MYEKKPRDCGLGIMIDMRICKSDVENKVLVSMQPLENRWLQGKRGKPQSSMAKVMQQMVGRDASKYYQHHLFGLDLFQAYTPKIHSLSELTDQTICFEERW